MTPEESTNNKSRLAIVIFVIVMVIVAIVAVFLTLASTPEFPDDGTPTTTMLITAAPFIPSETPIEIVTPTTIATRIPIDEGLIGLITPIEIVGGDISDLTDGLNVRIGPSFNDEVLRKMYVDDIGPLYGIDETGEWCMMGPQGVDGWVACKFVKPLPDECVVVLEAISNISTISDEDCESEES